jgi:hypothetical protein
MDSNPLHQLVSSAISQYELLQEDDDFCVIEDFIEYIVLCRQVSQSLNINTNISIALLYAIQKTIELFIHPNIEQIVSQYVAWLTCDCLNEISCQSIKEGIVLHLLRNTQFECRCSNIMLVFEYLIIENSLPNQDQLMAFSNTSRAFESNQQQFWNDTRILVPTTGLEYLIPEIMNINGIVCSICLEDIDKGSKIFKLPQCGHIFHADEGNCLGANASILTWLRTSRFCPNCNTEISVIRKIDIEEETESKDVENNLVEEEEEIKSKKDDEDTDYEEKEIESKNYNKRKSIQDETNTYKTHRKD